MQTIQQGMWTVGYRETHYVSYSFKDSSGWVSVGEFAFATAEQVDRFIADHLARYPHDEAKFSRRVA
jgi:hypothetical protein